MLAAPAAGAALALLPAAGMAAAPARSGAARSGWKGAWGRALAPRGEALPVPAGTVYAETVRPSLAGTALKLRLNNVSGRDTLFVDSVSLRLPDGAVVPVAFAGSGKVMVPAGATAVSDAVARPVKANEPIEVLVAFARPGALWDVSRSAKPEGASLRGTDGQVQTIAPHLIDEVDVAARSSAPVVVVLSDTKSAGEETWPFRLARLAAGRMGVVNRSVYGGHLALGPAGASALARLERDVLATAGATHTIVFTGNNDLIQPGMVTGSGRMALDPSLALETGQITGLLAQSAARIRAAGLVAIAGTWLPYEGVTIAQGYSTPEKLEKREQVNQWLRTSGAFDAVIDFDRALADPAHPVRLAAQFDSGNRFTPNDAGYDRMAEVALKHLLR